MHTRNRNAQRRLAIAALLLCGLALRVYFLLRHPFLAGDSILYQEIASNWLHHHIYGLTTDALPRATLIRLPGYPAILAGTSFLFDRFLHAEQGAEASFLPVLLLQIAADLCTCALLASLAARLFGERCRLPALALGCLCPFLANYTAVPLTETCTLLTIALSFWLAQRWRTRPRTGTLIALACSLAASALLRPDQGLLAIAVLPLLWRPRAARRWQPLVLCIAIMSLPFAAWTARNAHTFGVFQPLAPRSASDPGEPVPRGFQRWFRTWGVEFASTEDAYWKYPEEPVDLRDLPGRAFDSPAQFAQTRRLLEQADVLDHFDAGVDARFAALAADRIQAHPVRYWLALPIARLANMLLRPRLEMLPFEERWWQFHAHPLQTLLACAYAALNLAYLLLAAAGLRRALRWAPALGRSMAMFVILRCLLLLTLDNSEPRYTLELFPVLIVFAAALRIRRDATPGADPQSPERRDSWETAFAVKAAG